MGWSRRALLPSANAVIVLASAFDKADFKISSEAERLYRRWLCLTALRGVFQGSVETTINRFYRAIRESRKDPAKALVGALKRNERRAVDPDELYNSAQPWGPVTQVMLAWLVGNDAKDWLTGNLVNDLARGERPSLPGGDLTVHHIFPRRVLKDPNDNDHPDDANRPANYALLSQSTNAEFHDTPPDEVLAKLLPDQRRLAAAQFFGEAAGDRLKPDRNDEGSSRPAGSSDRHLLGPIQNVSEVATP